MIWRIYQPIEGVIMFDVSTFSSGTAQSSFLQVTARTDGASNYAVRIGALGDERLALTVEQSAQLRAQLEQAERDVQRGAVEDGSAYSSDEVTCTSCGHSADSSEVAHAKWWTNSAAGWRCAGCNAPPGAADEFAPPTCTAPHDGECQSAAWDDGPMVCVVPLLAPAAGDIIVPPPLPADGDLSALPVLNLDAMEYEATRAAEPDCRDEDGPEVERIMKEIDA